MSTYDMTLPISEEAVRSLRVGDTVFLSGVMTTGRDAAHKYMIETFIEPSVRTPPGRGLGAGKDGGPGTGLTPVPENEREVYEALKEVLHEGVIYHCGPVVRHTKGTKERPEGTWEFVAAGPTTSIREEVYEPRVIAHFGLRGVIGKGGMGPDTLRACERHGAVYFHAVGGAASLIADAVEEVLAVYKKDAFGVPEAFWVVRVSGFPVVVTMDTHGRSIHDEIAALSRAALQQMTANDQ
jgi:fumarate hydratase class I